MEWGGIHGSLLLAEALLTVDSFWRRKSQVLKGVTPGRLTHNLVDVPTPMCLWAIQIGLSGMGVYTCVHVCE